MTDIAEAADWYFRRHQIEAQVPNASEYGIQMEEEWSEDELVLYTEPRDE
jgi:hypothetical protein